MKVSSTILASFFKENDFIKKSLVDKIEQFTLKSAEIEGHKIFGNIDKLVVIAKILKIEPHSNADKLQIAIVDDGDSEKKIVCGAKNIKVGQLVPLAKIGAKLPNGLKIKKSKIRGETSEGMLCSGLELGICDIDDGIRILPKDSKISIPITEYFKCFNSLVFEIDNKSITHRGDLFSHEGIAREFSAIFDELELNGPFIPKKNKNNIENICVEIETKKCNIYSATKISEINIMNSDFSVCENLFQCDIRPINNIVDITNFMMIKFGQPMHAFDFAKIEGKKIIIKELSENDDKKFIGIDNIERELKVGDIVIMDTKKVIALAGIMGAKNSQVDENTKDIILEVANFDASSIRKTSQRIGLRTESSIRFEKKIHPKLVNNTMLIATNKIINLFPNAKISKSFSFVAKKNEITEKTITFDFFEFEKILGFKVKKEIIKDILEKLFFKVSFEKNLICVIVPYFRLADIEYSNCIIEEFARIYGFDKIKCIAPTRKMQINIPNKIREIREQIETNLVSNGFFETKTYVFTNKETIKKFYKKDCISNFIKIKNSGSEQHKFLRKSIIPNLFMEFLKNENIANKENFIFETGKVFSKKNNKYEEKEMLAGILFDCSENLSNHNIFTETFFKLKKKLNSLFKHIDINPKYIDDNKFEFAHPNRIAKILDFGFIGEIHPAIFDKFKIAFFELDIKKMSKKNTEKKYKKISKFPALRRDISLIVPKNISFDMVKKSIKSASNLIQKVDFFDIYHDDKKFNNKYSLSFHIEFRSNEKTLTVEEGENNFQKIINCLEKIKVEIKKA